MNNKRYGWALVVLVLVFGAAAILAYNKNHERATTLPTATNLALYGNDTYGYSFYYPPEYTVRVASEEDALIGLVEGSSFVPYAQARIATGTPDHGSYDDFVQETVKSLCAASSCTNVAKKEKYSTDTNLDGVAYTVTLPDGSSFGPVYTFNIGGNVQSAKFAALIIYRPTDTTAQTDTLTAQDLASKVQITKVERR